MKKRYVVIAYIDHRNDRPMYFQSRDRMGTTYISDITKAFRFRTRFMASREANKTRYGYVAEYKRYCYGRRI